LLKIVKKMLPKDNELPASTYEAKKVVCPLGLEVQKIHACINDCILYRGEYENLNAYPVCSAFRYKIGRDDPGDVKGERLRKRVPAKVPLFWCKWVKLIGGGVKVDQQYGITTVDLNNLGYRDEPFVLANNVAQIFYVKDMSTKLRKRKDKKTNTSHDETKRHIVLLGKRIIVGVDAKTDMSEDYNKFDEIPPFRVNTDTTILLNKEDTPWLRCRRKPQH
jgi:hypothetical protein